jgi:hypothetical protein
MGQAKQRGTQEQRAQQAKQKIEALKPDHIVCNNCKAEIMDVHVMDTRGIRGIDAAFAGLCPSCNQTTYALKGEPDAIADFAEAMQETMGDDPQIGSQNITG